MRVSEIAILRQVRSGHVPKAKFSAIEKDTWFSLALSESETLENAGISSPK